MTEQLFPGYPDPPEQTASQRLRARQQALLGRNRHPMTALPLIHNGHTCKDCVHRVRNERGYPKCDRNTLAHSEASDCRAGWPACLAWEAKP